MSQDKIVVVHHNVARLARAKLAQTLSEMAAEGGLALWGSFGALLFLLTFGPFAVFYLPLYLCCFITGGLAVTLLFGKTSSEKHLERCLQSFLPSTQPGIRKVVEEMKAESSTIKIDRRLTGSSVIDEPLQQVIQFALRDYIQYWYYTLGNDENFLLEIQQTVQTALVQLSARSKEVDWQTYFTTRLVDDFAAHLRVFRKAQVWLGEKEDSQREAPEDLLDAFFQAEVEMERKICRDVVCTVRKEEEGFLRDLCEVLLYLLLPPEDFHNKSMRYFIREVLARGVLLPLVSQLSDPDYINQLVIWMIGDSSCNHEAFMSILKLTDWPAELEAVRDKVLEELQYLRSLDTAGDDINMIKNQINSLLFVKKVCEARIQRLHSGKDVDSLKLAANLGKLCVIPLEHILVHNIALHFFMDFMQQVGGQADLFFWLTVEGYRVTAQQQLQVLQVDGRKRSGQTRGLLRASAQGVYEQYLSEQASLQVQVQQESVQKLAQKLQTEEVTPEIFNDIQRKVFERMLTDERFYPAFRQSALYVRMLAELDMLKEPSYRGSDDGDAESFNGSPTGSLNLCLDDLSNSSFDESLQLCAFISDTGVCNDHGKTYALYAITVFRTNLDGSEDSWKTYRRYSDFHDFHMRITQQFESLGAILKLPGKKTFNNMDRDFLDRRWKDLNTYLQLLLNPEMVKSCPSLTPYINDFLENKAYSKGKGDFARKMDTLVNPLRTSMRSVSHVMKSLPDSLAEGVTKMSDNMGRVSGRLGQDIKHSIFKVPPLIPKTGIDPEHCRMSAQLDDNVDENIPLRVLLLLMDEVFDLRERNQWLRRNIKNLLQQLIRAAYGDTINRKIVDHVDFMTSPEQVADYVKHFRDSFWPNGILAETPPLRDKNVRMRTRVAAKTKLLGVMPDELKHMVGAETARRGVLRVFDVFQHQQLNRRLVYVLLEGLLECTFPQCRLPELLTKLHSRSPRTAGHAHKR
ncbi:sorting nexin-13-like isoform X1 [Anguilla anguilla]|uniref:sorting nexin-13-like isoform X1 n=1 Tax=Anguilla anguilla TaxID=7936 RepID=UPI0015B13D60|nr:sorting nexin-13-like isoform X1 [Anguilla anguilla]